MTAEAVELPCAFGAAGSALTAALDRVRPEVAIAVGLAGGTAAVRVERVAVNLQDARIPDNAGDQPVDRPVRADGPAALFATLPAKRAVAAIRAAGVAAEPSLSAGAFVCNHVMYALLDAPAPPGPPASSTCRGTPSTARRRTPRRCPRPTWRARWPRPP